MEHERRGAIGAAPASVPDDSGSVPAAPHGDDQALWLAILPTAGILVAALLWLVPPLARLAYPAPSWRPYPSAVQLGLIRPEGTEQTRYLLATTAPIILVGMWLLLRRLRPGRLPQGVSKVVVVAVEVTAAVLGIACWAAQKRAYHWFDDTTLAVAAVVAATLVAASYRGWLAPSSAVGVRRRLRDVGAAAIAVVVTAYWLLPAVYNTTNAVTVARLGQLRQIEFLQDELASVLGGRTPMVNFASQYSKLLPFVAAPIFGVLSPSIGVTTAFLAFLGILAFLAVYGIFVVLTEDRMTALILYLPFLALSLYTLLTTGDERFNLSTLFGVVPIRVLGPFVLGWLCARQLRGGIGRGGVLLFAGAGLVAINNTEFGAAAFLALGLALWCGHDGRCGGWARARRLTIDAVIGGTIAVAAVCALTLVRSGSLPDPGYVVNLTRVFAVEGFGMEPIRPNLGLHILIYVTFVAAIVAGVTGGVASEDFSPRARVLRGLLAYSGLLGLGAGAYWVGRSVPSALFGMFPTWALAVAVLCWAVLRGVAARAGTPLLGQQVRRVLPAAGILLGFGLMVTVLAQVPTPASQLRRFRADGLAVPQYEARVKFIAAGSPRGEHVAILAPVGHLLARDTGVVNVSPYADETSIAFYEQMDLLLDGMRKSGVRTVYVAPTWPETSSYLAEKGFVAGLLDTASGLTRWTRSQSSR